MGVSLNMYYWFRVDGGWLSHCCKAYEKDYGSLLAPRLVEPLVKMRWACKLREFIPRHCLNH